MKKDKEKKIKSVWQNLEDLLPVPAHYLHYDTFDCIAWKLKRPIDLHVSLSVCGPLYSIMSSMVRDRPDKPLSRGRKA